uniref:Crystallin J1A-like n=1 Tax=Crassostrea virginica TaxID=6565 RepID=A0A8B8D4Y2_CRAVI|nr:crystallin J1A-like [Crassostrea virginica]
MSKIRTFLVTSEFFAPKCLPLVWKNFLIHTNIAQAPDMTCLEERKIGAIVGALVADAAAQPLHWNYKTADLDEFLKDKDEVAFVEPSRNPFYCIQTGKHSCYGDQSRTILRSLVENNGVNVEKLKESLNVTFGPNTEYENEDNATYKDKSDVVKKVYPINSSWRHSSIKSFLKKYKEGEEITGIEDNQMDCVVNVVSVVALYAGRPDMLERVEEVVTITQNSDINVAVACTAARLLEYFILHGKTPGVEALNSVLGALENPKRHHPQDLDRGMVGHMKKVIDEIKTDHVVAARKFNIS